MLKLSAAKPKFQNAIARLERTTIEQIRFVLRSVGIETVAYLRSLTSEIRPSARRGRSMTGPRRAHPGHWADITSQLALSYSWEVEETNRGARLKLTNSANYAVYLEMMDGYFVLTGVTEPGGPVEEAIKSAAATIAPGWRVRLG